MGNLLTYKEGRLRTGRVAFLAFILLLVCLGGLFKVSRRMDKALVAVRHVFEPRQQAIGQTHETSKPQSARSDPEKTDTKSGETAGIHSPESEIAKKGSDSPGENLQQKAAPKSAGQVTGSSAAAVGTEKTGSDQSGNDTNSTGETATEITAAPEESAGNVQSDPSEPKEITLDVSDKLKQIVSWSDKPEKEKHIDIASGTKSLLKKEDKEQARKPKNLSFKQPHSISPLKVDTANKAITVSSKQYLELFRNWQKAGNGGHGSEKIPLRVENLKNAYSLFQMKPVAVVGNRLYFDLSDSTRIPPAVLADYSTTVFRVDNPKEKWGTALEEAGVRDSDRVEIRYYMYDFIKKAIYTRTYQAFRWSMDKGLIDAGTSLGDVDVLGRAYVIRKHGGGRFGVFVPVLLDTRDGRSIAIDPICFHGQPDIEALQTAGLL